jgi:cold shock protein
VQIGKLKFWNESKGFGFIAPQDDSRDVFVHVSAFHRAGIRDIEEGEKLSFEIEADKRTGRPAATNLAVVR